MLNAFTCDYFLEGIISDADEQTAIRQVVGVSSLNEPGLGGAAIVERQERVQLSSVLINWNNDGSVQNAFSQADVGDVSKFVVAHDWVRLLVRIAGLLLAAECDSFLCYFDERTHLFATQRGDLDAFSLQIGANIRQTFDRNVTQRF